MATTNESIATRGCNAVASKPIGRLARLAFALALVCGAGPVLAQDDAFTITDPQDTCAGFRQGGNGLNCTAGEATVGAVFTPVAGGGTCIAGEPVAVNVQINLDGANTPRDDYGFFAGIQGNDPALATPGNICSVTIFDANQAFNTPFLDNDNDACLDLDNPPAAQATATGITVLCDPDVNGNLQVPFVLTYTQSGNDVCTGTADVQAGTNSKCNKGVGIVTGLLPQGFVNVTKVTTTATGTDFVFAASGTPTPTPTAFTLDTDAADLTFSNTQQVLMPIVQGTPRTLTIDEATTPGWEVTSIVCTAANGSGPVIAFTPNLANGSFSVGLNDVSFGANCTVTNGPVLTRVRAAKTIVNGNGGLFNLTVEGNTTTDVGNGGTTAFVAVTPGNQVNISETAGTGADLADYTTTYSCVNESAVVVTSGNGAVIPPFIPTVDQDTTCTFTNTRTLVADLDLTKTLNETGPFLVGDVVSFDIVVSNNGPDAATAVVVSDTTQNFTITNVVSVPAGCTGFPCNIASIPSGGSVTITVTGTIDNATPGKDGMVDFGNSAGAVSPVSPDSPTDGDFDKAQPQAPALTLDKTSATVTYAAVGDSISYSYLVTNSGNVGLAGPVTVADDKAVVTCPAVSTVGDLDATLDPGEAITCTASYTVVQADLDSGSVTNVATASAGGTDSNQDTVTVTGTQTRTLLLDKTAAPTTYSMVGQVISYMYLVTNTGNVTLIGPVTVSDDKATVVCPAGNLAPGGFLTCTASYTITQADINAGSVTNTATASVASSETISNTDTATVTATQSTGLTLDKTSSTANYDSVGDTLSYSYLVTNSGNVSLAGPVTVADDRATVTCPAVSTVGNNDASLDPGESITCTATYTIVQADLNAGNVTNTATATAGGVNSNPDSVVITAVVSSTVTLDKTTTSTGYSAVGNTLSYSYLVTNTGNVALAGPVTVADNRVTVSCPAGGLAPGASITCTATYVVTQADINAGSVTNTATATVNGITSNTDTVTVNATQARTLLLDKTTTSTSYSAVGNTLSYSYRVTNTGNVTLAGPVTVTDNRATVTCPAGALAPAAFITCTATYTVTQADINAGSVTNTATAAANGVTSNTDTVTVNATVNTGLLLDKTTTSTGYNAAGQTISYSYRVTNTGNATLAGPVTVADNRATVTCPAGSLAPAAFITCTATYTVTQADITAGSVTNTATASANGVTSNTDSVTVQSTFVPFDPALPVPVDSRWMLIAMALLLGFAARRRISAVRRG